jgi:hypothetical protein
MTRVTLDFPDAAGRPDRLTFEAPLRIITAGTVAEIRAALRDAEAAARHGAWVAGCVAYEAAPAFDPRWSPAPMRVPCRSSGSAYSTRHMRQQTEGPAAGCRRGAAADVRAAAALRR